MDVFVCEGLEGLAVLGDAEGGVVGQHFYLAF